MKIKISQWILFTSLLLILIIMVFKIVQLPVIKYNKVPSEKSFKYYEEDKGIVLECYMGDISTLVIPDEIDGLPVVGLDFDFFDHFRSQKIKKIVLPRHLNSLYNTTFSFCKNLKEIEVPDENKYFESIDGILFNKDQTTLIKYPVKKANKHYIIPQGVNVVEESAFESCKNLNKVTFPKGLTFIKQKAFAGCEHLKTAALPEGLIVLGESSFENCSALRKIEIPSTLAKIDERVFYQSDNIESIKVAEGNKTFKSEEDILFDSEMTTLYKFPINKNITSYTIPESVKVIRDYAFGGARSFREVILPKDLEKIGEGAFAHTDLKSILIPKSVTKVGDKVFSDCRNLQSIGVDKENEAYRDIDGVLFDKAQTVLIAYPAGKQQSDYKIPNDVNVIGKYAFEAQNHLTAITIPLSVKIIDEFAFCNSSLKTLKIPKGVESIESGAFKGCKSLKQVVIEGRLLEVGESVFDNRNVSIVCDDMTMFD